MGPGRHSTPALFFAGALLWPIPATASALDPASLLDSLVAISSDRGRLSEERSYLASDQTRMEGNVSTERRSFSLAPSTRVASDGRIGANIAASLVQQDWEIGGESGRDPLDGLFINLGLGYSVLNERKSLRKGYAELARSQDRKAELEWESQRMRDVSFVLSKVAETYFLARESDFLRNESASIDSILVLMNKLIDQGYLNRSASNSLASHQAEVELRLETIRLGIGDAQRELSTRIRPDSGFVSSLRERFPEILSELQSRIQAAFSAAGSCYHPLRDRLDSLDNAILRQRIALLKILPHNVVLSVDAKVGESLSESSIGAGARFQWTWLEKKIPVTAQANPSFCLDPTAITYSGDGGDEGERSLRKSMERLDNLISQSVQEVLLGNRTGVFQISELFSRKVAVILQMEERKRRSVSGFLSSITDIPVFKARLPVRKMQ